MHGNQTIRMIHGLPGRDGRRGGRVKKPLRLVLTVLAGVVLGYGLTVGALLYKASHIGIYNPAGWMTARGIGSSDADPLLKALVARIGIFANSWEEAVYLQAFVGDPQKRLRGDHHYRIEGSARVSAQWWSVTLYNDRELLHDNPENRYSFTDFNVQTRPDGSFAIDVAPRRPPGAANWLPSPAGDVFSVTLRIYRPAPELVGGIETFPLPRVSRVP